MIDLGIVRPGSTIRIPFSSFDKDDGSAITMTNYAAADILVYKDGSTTERASTAGFTATTDFDAKTGKHLAVIDLADNTTAGFWNAGSEYLVAIDAVTIDAVTTGGWIARFRIGYIGAWFDTTIATLSSQTSFTLTVGPAEDDALNGAQVYIHDIASAVQCGWAVVSDYTGSTKTVTLAAGTTFTAAAGDNISIMRPMPLQPTVAGRALDVSTGGEAGLDWANIGSPTTAQNLSATNIDVDQVVASVSGAVGSVGAGGITASSIAADAIGASELAADAVAEIADAIWDEAQSGHTSAGTFGRYLDAQVANVEADTQDLQARIPAALTAGGNIKADALAISGDATAADNLETMLDGTGGQTLSLGKLNVVSASGDAIVATAGGNGHGINASGSGTGHGIAGTGGATDGIGIIGIGQGAGAGLEGFASGSGGSGATFIGNGAGHGLQAAGGTTGNGITAQGGSNGSATATNGIIGIGGTANGVGIKGNGAPSGAGIGGLGGATTGAGIRGSATTDSAGIEGQGAGTAAGIVGYGGATGAGIRGDGGATSGPGASFAASAGNSNGLTCAKSGSGVDISGDLAGSIGSLATQAKADVNTEVLDVLNTDTFAEPGQEAPGATVSLVKKIGYLYKFLRNKITQDATTLKVYADDASTVDQKATVSDDGTTYTRGEIGTGP